MREALVGHRQHLVDAVERGEPRGHAMHRRAEALHGAVDEEHRGEERDERLHLEVAALEARRAENQGGYQREPAEDLHRGPAEAAPALGADGAALKLARALHERSEREPLGGVGADHRHRVHELGGAGGEVGILLPHLSVDAPHDAGQAPDEQPDRRHRRERDARELHVEVEREHDEAAERHDVGRHRREVARDEDLHLAHVAREARRDLAAALGEEHARYRLEEVRVHRLAQPAHHVLTDPRREDALPVAGQRSGHRNGQHGSRHRRGGTTW